MGNAGQTYRAGDQRWSVARHERGTAANQSHPPPLGWTRTDWGRSPHQTCSPLPREEEREAKHVILLDASPWLRLIKNLKRLGICASCLTWQVSVHELFKASGRIFKSLRGNNISFGQHLIHNLLTLKCALQYDSLNPLGRLMWLQAGILGPPGPTA